MIPFWAQFANRADLPALVDASTGVAVSYRELATKLEKISTCLDCSTKKLIFLPLANSLDNVVFYLGALASRHAVAIYDPQIGRSERKHFAASFGPDLIIEEEEFASQADSILLNLSQRIRSAAERNADRKIHANLKLLLSTSGSTGYRKFVRLSGNNITSNALQIVTALKIRARDRTLTTLPLTYVYGLSVLHSHLCAGACVVVGQYSVLDKELWRISAKYDITSFYGVPWTFQTIRPLISSGQKLFPPSLRSLCVAGGRSDPDTSAWLNSAFGSTEIYFMYGQTEAAGRIAVLPPQFSRVKAGSVGLPVLGGKIEIDANGEVRSRGPTVMLGYASSSRDLILDDQLKGLLKTGDLGYLDNEGFLYLTGRCSRIVKLFGLRFDLDEVQAHFDDITQVVVQKKATEEKLIISFATDSVATIEARMYELCSRWHLPKAAWELRKMDALKRLPSGKLSLTQYEE